MRKCYIVDMAALDALPQYPPDLEKWIIPKDELVLPVDIYSAGTLIIDDGYDRASLNVPGVLHIECAAKWSQERPSQALPGRSSGFTSHLHPEALDDCVLPTPLALPPQTIRTFRSTLLCRFVRLRRGTRCRALPVCGIAGMRTRMLRTTTQNVHCKI